MRTSNTGNTEIVLKLIFIEVLKAMGLRCAQISFSLAAYIKKEDKI